MYVTFKDCQTLGENLNNLFEKQIWQEIVIPIVNFEVSLQGSNHNLVLSLLPKFLRKLWKLYRITKNSIFVKWNNKHILTLRNKYFLHSKKTRFAR